MRTSDSCLEHGVRFGDAVCTVVVRVDCAEVARRLKAAPGSGAPQSVNRRSGNCPDAIPRCCLDLLAPQIRWFQSYLCPLWKDPQTQQRVNRPHQPPSMPVYRWSEEPKRAVACRIGHPGFCCRATPHDSPTSTHPGAGTPSRTKKTSRSILS